MLLCFMDRPAFCRRVHRPLLAGIGARHIRKTCRWTGYFPQAGRDTSPKLAVLG